MSTTNETSLDTYIRWIREEGLVVSSNKQAHRHLLQVAINNYGLGAVRKEIEPIVPELVETTYNYGISVWNEDNKFDKERRAEYESFRDAYNKGEIIEIGPFKFQKN